MTVLREETRTVSRRPYTRVVVSVCPSATDRLKVRVTRFRPDGSVAETRGAIAPQGVDRERTADELFERGRQEAALL